jgi:hypothetical protein
MVASFFSIFQFHKSGEFLLKKNTPCKKEHVFPSFFQNYYPFGNRVNSPQPPHLKVVIDFPNLFTK